MILSDDRQVVLVDGLYNPASDQLQFEQSINCKDLCYLSPEQLGVIHEEPGPHSDLYSIGILLYECLAGRPPFVGNDVNKLIFDHVSSSVAPLHTFGVKIPGSFDELLRRLLNKNPLERYQTAKSLAFDLQLIKNTLESGHQDPCIALGTTDARTHLIEPSFVGRQNENQSTVGRIVGTGKTVCSGFIVTQAESGCGKTTVIDKFKRDAEAHGCWVLRGVASNQVGATTYSILNGVVDGIIAHKKQHPKFDVELEADQKSAVANVLPGLAESLGWVHGKELGPEAFGETRNINALCNLFVHLAQKDQPVVLVLDDCQWVDESTVKLIHQLQKSPERDSGGPTISDVGCRLSERGSSSGPRAASIISHDEFGSSPFRHPRFAFVGAIHGRCVCPTARWT